MTTAGHRQAAFGHVAGAEDFAAAFPVSRDTLARLEVYATTLALWQKRINLVAPATLNDVWHRHIADSAQLLKLAPADARTWIDLGSGAGFPGLVVAILLADDPARELRVTLVESDQRKCAFLAEVVRKAGLGPGLSVDILCARIEAAATRARLATGDVVSARALAPLGRLLELASPLLGSGSTGLFPKGRSAESEIEEAKRVWQFAYDVVASRSDTEARIVRVRGRVVRSEG
ncbi:MAG: 16S rRNA (guanine(527)-N(7))-methyltransferase RsmG [Hyphomicrobiaceae bacterium]|nr:16S rRNA (guanine(527)-N(7))-methyltransferase RsmG [Hyphomicrobiaceae bacterium]